MCFLRPLRVKKIKGKIAFLDNNIKAYFNEKAGKIKKGDWVMVYGNLILNKTNGPSN